jgi:hypothetical protein
MENLEVVFGRADILGEMGSYFYYQELLIKDLISATRGKDHIKAKIDSGAIKLFVVQEIISHEKRSLLEGDAGTRVITGSANFSDRAFSGAQNESYVRFDDDVRAWEHFNAAYEKIKDRSTTSIIERAQIDGEFDPENLPAFAPARKNGKGATPKVILVQDAPPETSIVHRAAAKPPERYGGISSAVQAKGAMAKIDRSTAKRAIVHVKSNWRTREENPEESLSIHLDSGQVSLSGKPLDLEVTDHQVAADVRAWVAYFAGYRIFRGEHEKLARDYFTFWSWFYAGAFLCDLRNAALVRGDDVWDYPLYGILYGKSNCGKSELIKTLLASMFDRDAFPPNDWFTRANIPAVMEQNRRYPLVFDDMEKLRFGQHADALIKNDHVRLKEYPAVVLSMNAGQDTFDSELRKRALVVYTGASLPDHTGEAKKLRRQLKSIKRDLGTALYREYLRRVLPLVRDEIDEPIDVLKLSSSVLVEIISEHLEAQDDPPPWLRVVTMEEYGQGRHDRVRGELIQLWVNDQGAWSQQGTKIIYRSEDIHGTITKLKRGIPDYLYGTGSRGNVIVFDAVELEKFLQITLSQRNGYLRSLARLLGR